MRWVVLVGLMAAWGAVVNWPAGAVDGPQPAPTLDQVSGSTKSLIGLSFAAGDKQQVTVIDPERMAMSVYHIDAASGAIELKSVRRIEWDLEMVQFNAVDPVPKEIRSLLEQHR